ncbi:MAG: hypothetical protein Tsb0019_13190 [Roseibium sp.]
MSLLEEGGGALERAPEAGLRNPAAAIENQLAARKLRSVTNTGMKMSFADMLAKLAI